MREFDEQICEASDGAIQSKREERIKRAASGVKALLNPLDMKRYNALVATNDRGDQEELCELEIATYGSPVGLRYADVSARYHDRESLETGLVKLLEHPVTGGKPQRLLASAGTGEPRK